MDKEKKKKHHQNNNKKRQRRTNMMYQPIGRPNEYIVWMREREKKHTNLIAPR